MKNYQNFLSDLKTHLERNTKDRAVAWIGCDRKQNRSVDMTNAEKIRSMSDEELAEEFLADQLLDDQLSCGHCYYICNNAYGCKYDSCKNGILKWLQLEAE